MKSKFCYLVKLSQPIFLMFLINACSTGLGKELNVNIPVAVDSGISNSYEKQNLSIIIKEFKDSRQDKFIGEIDGRKLLPKGNINEAIQSSFYKHLKAVGIKNVMYDATSFEGELLQWSVKVKPGFPLSKIEGTSSINLVVYNKQGQSIYKANYTGSYKLMDPFPSERKIEKVLTSAMAESVRQVVEDKDLFDKLSLY